MKRSKLKADIDRLQQQISLKEAEYLEAIKNGKEFQEAKALYLDLKKLKRKFEKDLKEFILRNTILK